MSEKDELCGAPAAIGMVVLALLFGGVVLAICPGWAVVAKYLKSSTAAAWVQAIGSIAAIIFSGFFIRWQVRENKRISDRQKDELKNQKKSNVLCVIQDELEYIERNIKGFDLVFEKRYQMKNARRRSGFFKPRPLNPILLEEVMSEYYSDYSSKERLGIKSILTIYPALNSYADRCELHNKKRFEYERDLSSSDFRDEVLMAMYYIKSGLIYYHTLREFLGGGDLPVTAESDGEIIKNLHRELNLKIDLDFLIWTTWKYDTLIYKDS